GVRARLFTVDDLAGVPLAGRIFAEIAEDHPALDETRLIHESVRRMIDAMVNDVIAETRRRVSRARPESADAVRRLGRPLVAFSDEMRDHDRALKAFLGENMYRHDRVTRITDVVQPVVRELFTAFMADAGQLPADWRERAAGVTEPRRARLVADYIAGMTDRFAIAEYDRVFNTSLSLK
ncbi:MAG: deoxyguanosinetriphosphate triphosphohydrolase, partial [Proteobacteria bacterium]|nr:deoxyguanosinetriphosphate triphosphohydrolase [Pseudomonadota bacterium]